MVEHVPLRNSTSRPRTDEGARPPRIAPLTSSRPTLSPPPPPQHEQEHREEGGPGSGGHGRRAVPAPEGRVEGAHGLLGRPGGPGQHLAPDLLRLADARLDLL